MLSRLGLGLVLCAALMAAGCETFRPQTDVRGEYERGTRESSVLRDGQIAVRVRPGETLSGIARDYGTTPQAIANATGLSDVDNIVVGEKLIIPAKERRTAAVAPVRRSAQQPQRRQSEPQPRADQIAGSPSFRMTSPREAGVAVAPLVEVTRASAIRSPSRSPRENDLVLANYTPAEAAPRASNSKGKFGWPIAGKVIVGYGVRESGQQNDGINIAAIAGAPVRAAADGEVTFTGQIKSYGKIILVSHSGGYVTAYAHNSEIRVQKGDRVKRGQTIGLAGATGSVDSPQVHFEIRRKGEPVDPRKLLVALN